MASKRKITVVAKALFEVARWYDQYGNKREGPMHEEWDQGSNLLRDAFRRAARAGLKAAETFEQ